MLEQVPKNILKDNIEEHEQVSANAIFYALTTILHKLENYSNTKFMLTQSLI